MNQLDELLNIEFSEDNNTDTFSECLITKQDGTIIYFALKYYFRHLANSGASLPRITRTVELANVFRDYAKEYLESIVNNLTEAEKRQEFELEVKNELEN